ncbi:MAG: hypothetical protein Q4A16_06390 [Lautropia sp.]|nr:hypothetical protein [Lautropia sp.]
MFEGVTDQADGLRRLFRMQQGVLIPAGHLVDEPVARQFAQRLVMQMAGRGQTLDVVDRQTMAAMLENRRVDEGGRPRHCLWLDDPIDMAQWVTAQEGDRMLLILSHRREAMMDQYAQIKRISSTTGIRRFGLMFVDIEQVARGRQTFLGLAGCARRFLGVRLDVVVSSAQDESSLEMWSGLSTADLAEFECSSWSERGMPSLGADRGGVAH